MEAQKKKVQVEDVSLRMCVGFRGKGEGNNIYYGTEFEVKVVYQPGCDTLHCQRVHSESCSTNQALIFHCLLQFFYSYTIMTKF